MPIMIFSLLSNSSHHPLEGQGIMLLFLLASGPADIEIQFELGSNLQFKLSRQKMCVSMVENVDKKSNHRSGSNISSHVVFIYSLLIAFILAVLLGIFVTLMQKKYEAQLAKNDIVQSKPAAGKLFSVGNCN